ncbi:MAG: hypothetical protein COB36_05465 [Alphaproteobacteria bacterium]|nr:MAG: hypothetical protein COB36_05465 [Alphaproteobacteria bacterium]
MGLGFRGLGKQFTSALQGTYDKIGDGCDFTYNTIFARQNATRAQTTYDKALEGIKFIHNDPSPPETFNPSSEEGKAIIQKAADRLETSLEIVADTSARWEPVHKYFIEDPEGMNGQRRDDDGASPS